MSSRPSQWASAGASRRPLRTPTSSRPPTTNGPFKTIHQADLPVITTGSGHNIIDIKNSIINYCLCHDRSRISMGDGPLNRMTTNVVVCKDE